MPAALLKQVGRALAELEVECKRFKRQLKEIWKRYAAGDTDRDLPAKLLSSLAASPSLPFLEADQMLK